MRKALILMGLTVVSSSALFMACGSSSGDDTTPAPASTSTAAGGTSSAGGSTSTAGHAGASGASAGNSGGAGTSGAAGSTGGSAGHSGAGAGGGTAGATTAGGSAGVAGAAGASGGAGTAGASAGGAAGSSTAGSGGESAGGASGAGGSTADPTCGGFFMDQTNQCDLCGASTCCDTSVACEGDTACAACLNGGADPGCDLTSASPNAALKALADCLTTNGVQPDATGAITGTCATKCQGPLDCAAPADSTTGGSCIPMNSGDFPCNPVTGGGCTNGDACDVGMNNGKLVVACQPGTNTAVTCGACSYSGLAPFCVSGDHCVPENGSTSFACAKFCCDDTDCGGDGHCDTAFLGLPANLSKFGLCLTDTGSGGAAGAGGSSAAGAAGASTAGSGGSSAAGTAGSGG